MQKGCIDLLSKYGNTYRVELDRTQGRDGQLESSWMRFIPCYYGHIYPWGGNRLAVSVDGHPNVAGVVRNLPFVDVLQDGDFGELTAVFLEWHIKKIAEIMGARKKRQMSQESLERLRSIGFKKGDEHA